MRTITYESKTQPGQPHCSSPVMTTSSDHPQRTRTETIINQTKLLVMPSLAHCHNSSSNWHTGTYGFVSPVGLLESGFCPETAYKEKGTEESKRNKSTQLVQNVDSGYNAEYWGALMRDTHHGWIHILQTTSYVKNGMEKGEIRNRGQWESSWQCWDDESSDHTARN